MIMNNGTMIKEKELPFGVLFISIILIAFISGWVSDLFNKRVGFVITELVASIIIFLGIFVILKLPFNVNWHELGFRKNKFFFVASTGLLIGYLSGLTSLVLFSLNQQTFSDNIYKFNPIYQVTFYITGIVHPKGLSVAAIAFAEEILFRGILLRKAIVIFSKSKFIPICIVGIVFTFFHLGYYYSINNLLQILFGVSFFLIIQIICCCGVLKFNNLFFSIFLHYAYNESIYSVMGFNS
jgi:membrane protease YdiL (CAAX protease family)